MIPIKLRRGLLRVWIVISIAWLAAAGAMTGFFPIIEMFIHGRLIAEEERRQDIAAYSEGCKGKDFSECLVNISDFVHLRTTYGEATDQLGNFLVVGVGGSLIGLIMGCLVFWAAAGFRPNTKGSDSC